MPLVNMKQVQGGKELQGNVNALLDVVGKDKDAFFNEMLNWLLSEAPQDFNPEILKSSKLAMLVSSAVDVNNKPDAPSKTPYLSFLEENGEPFALKTKNTSKNWDGILEYSTDTLTWTTWTGAEISSSNDGKLYLRGTGNTKITEESNGDSSFVLTYGKRIQCIGNIETLLDYATVLTGNHPAMANYCYVEMFLNCRFLTVAPSLPAIRLTDYCYYRMFEKCTSLTVAPELPSTTLADSCYTGMFQQCTSLTTVPELPATVLTEFCYQNMFYDCTALTTPISLLPATTLANKCYYQIFYNCDNLSGTIHCPSSTSSDTNKLVSGIDYPGNVTVVYDL